MGSKGHCSEAQRVSLYTCNTSCRSHSGSCDAIISGESTVWRRDTWDQTLSKVRI